ncbi:MAG: hypothetical protein ACK5M3_18450 [Dysgonomonas sp.]
METYSPYIRKYQKKIREAGYWIDVSGNRFRKHIGRYEVLITDLTVNNLIMVKRILVWVRDTKTGIVEQEKFFCHEISPLPFSKVDDFAREIIAQLDRLSREKKNLSDCTVTKDSSSILSTK